MAFQKEIVVLASSLSSAFVSESMVGLEEGLRGSGLGMRLVEVEVSDPIAANRRVEELALASDVAGVMYVHMPMNVRQIALFKECRIPVAYLAGRMEGIDWCMVDETKGAYEATRHLLGMGHRRLAVISGPLVALESRLREDGFLRALKEDGLEFGRQRDIKILNFSEGEGWEAANLLLGLAEPPTAIFVSAGDLTAVGVLEALQERGLDVPKDISVVGFDDLDFSEHLAGGLTTVRQPLRAMGSRCMARLVDAVRNPAHVPGGDLFEPQLMLRATTGKPGHPEKKLELKVPARG